MLLFLALGLALFPPADAGAPPPEDDVRVWLDRLRADSADQRALAQRWLGRHLAEQDLDLVRTAAIAGDAEVRQRLALALADDDRHVSIAVQLAASPDASAAAVGRSALVESIAQWSPGWTQPGLGRDETFAKLSKSSALRDAPPIAIDPRTKPPRLDLALEELARLVPGAPQLVLDPDWAIAKPPRERSGATPAQGDLEGTFERVLRELLDRHEADCDGFDFSDQEGLPSRPWILVGQRPDAAHRSSADLLAGWCELFLQAKDPARRGACARAIAASGWPAGIAWLERRWRAGPDDAALDGVLLAAGRGLVAPSLSQGEVQRDLYRSMRAAATGSAANPARAYAIARAIAAAGPRGSDGEDLAALAVEDLQSAPPREQWLRLAAVEGMRSSSADAARAIDALLAAPGVPPPVAFQALRARSAARTGRAGAIPVRDAPGILAWADSTGRADECGELLASLGVPPPKPGDARPSPARSPSRSLAELEWTVATAEASAAARVLLELAAPVDRGGLPLETIAQRTRGWVIQGTGDRFEAALAAARSMPGADPARLDRLALLSAAGSPDLNARLLAGASAPSSREDLLCLGALSAGSDGGEALATLLRLVATYKPLDDVVAALDLALTLLRASRDDLAERELVQSVRRVAKEGPPELRVRFLVGTWPTQADREVLRGRDSDRSLEASSLP